MRFLHLKSAIEVRVISELLTAAFRAGSEFDLKGAALIRQGRFDSSKQASDLCACGL